MMPRGTSIYRAAGSHCIHSAAHSSVQFSLPVVSDSFRPYGLLHASLPCPSPTPGACSSSCSLSQWCYLTILSSVIPFFSCPQFFPASGSFPMSWLFASGGQNIGASASILPINIKGWFPLGWTGWMSLLSNGLSRVFSSTTVQQHQFFSTLPSLWSNSHIHNCCYSKLAQIQWLKLPTWLLEKP